VVGLTRWVGVLKVTGAPFYSSEPRIWASDDFPSRVDVEIELELTPETGVPALGRELERRLTSPGRNRAHRRSQGPFISTRCRGSVDHSSARPPNLATSWPECGCRCVSEDLHRERDGTLGSVCVRGQRRDQVRKDLDLTQHSVRRYRQVKGANK
jgi:hypothetical protein